MIIEYLAQLGNLQIKNDGHRNVLSPERTTEDGDIMPASDYSNELQIIQDLASALWAIPETRDTTPHKKIVFSEHDYVVRVDGRALTPESDISGETQEVQTFVDTIYGENRDSQYAEYWQAAQVEEVPEEPTEAEKIEIKRRNVLRELGAEYEKRHWVDIETTDIDDNPATIQFRHYRDRANFETVTNTADILSRNDPESTVTFRVKDNTVRTFKAADFVALAMAVQADRQQILYTYGDKKEEVRALETLDELNGYDIKSEW